MDTPREARILIVDDHREIARTLRTMLELTERGYFVVDVPSGEEALLEIRRVEFDVLVADYRLAGMNGLELIERAQEMQPGIHTILISAYSLDEMQHPIRSLGVRQVFAKPVDADLFVNTVRDLLGDHAAPHSPAVEDDSGAEADPVVHYPPAPTPTVDNNALVWELSSLVVNLGAQGALLVSPEGGLMLQEGLLYDTEGMERLAAEMGPVLTALPYISQELGEAEGASVQYYAGKQRDVYLLSPAGAFGLVLVFPGGSQREMGAVLRYGRPAVETIRRTLVGTVPELVAAPTRSAEEVPPPPAPAFEPATPVEPAPTEHEAELSEPLAALPEEPEDLFALPPTEAFDTLDFDVDELAAELDASTLENLDSFWEQAAALQGKINEDALSLDEALQMGLIDSDEDGDLGEDG